MRYMACFFNAINPTVLLVQAAGERPDVQVCRQATLVFYLKDPRAAVVFKDRYSVLTNHDVACVSEAQMLEWLSQGQPKLGWNWKWIDFDTTNYYDLS